MDCWVCSHTYHTGTLHLFRFLHHSSTNPSNQPALHSIRLNLFPHSFRSTAPTHSAISPISERFKLGFLFVTLSLAFHSHTRYHTHGLTPAYTQLPIKPTHTYPYWCWLRAQCFCPTGGKKKTKEKRRDRQQLEEVKKKKKKKSAQDSEKKIGPQEQTGKGCIFTPGSTNGIKTLARRCYILQLDLLRFFSPRVVELQETRYSTVPCRRLHDRSAFTRQSYSFVHLLYASEGIVNHGVGHPHPSNSSTHTNTYLCPYTHPLRPLSVPLAILGITTTDQILSDPRFQHYILDY